LKIPLVVGVYLADEVGEDGFIVGGAAAGAGSADDLVISREGKNTDGSFYAGAGAGGTAGVAG
jgi:hypothetical protein